MKLFKLTSSILSALGIMFLLVGDKILDAIISIFTEGGLSENEILPFILSLVGVVFLMWVVQSGVLQVFSALIKKFRGQEKVDEVQEKLRDARVTIKRGLQHLKFQQTKFDRDIFSASHKIRALREGDRQFSSDKAQAAQAVMDLRDDYHSSMNVLERTIEQLCQDIDDAEELFLDSEESSQELADKFYRES